MLTETSLAAPSDIRSPAHATSAARASAVSILRKPSAFSGHAGTLRVSWGSMSISRTARFSGAGLALLAVAGCASKYVPTQRMTSIQASLDKGQAARIFTKALTRSPTASGLCRASFLWDDPRPAATTEAFSVQAFRRGEEVGRTKEKDYKGNETTVVHYRKDRYVEERRFSEIGKVRTSKEVTGICVDASARAAKPPSPCTWGGSRSPSSSR